MSNSPSTTCRNGNCTSSECSAACGASEMPTRPSSRSRCRLRIVDRHFAERRGEGIDRRHGEPAHRHAVARPEQHDVADRSAGVAQQPVGAAGDRPGVGLARVRDDQRLRAGATGPARAGCRCSRHHRGAVPRRPADRTVRPPRAAEPLTCPVPRLNIAVRMGVRPPAVGRAAMRANIPPRVARVPIV